jgi:hypothetical protein
MGDAMHMLLSPEVLAALAIAALTAAVVVIGILCRARGTRTKPSNGESAINPDTH